MRGVGEFLYSHPVLMVLTIVVAVAAVLIGTIVILAVAIWGNEWPDGSPRLREDRPSPEAEALRALRDMHPGPRAVP